MYKSQEYKQAKDKLDQKFKKKWSNIIEKYSNVQDEGDIVDLKNIEIVQDNGHLRSIRTNSSIHSVYYSDEEEGDSNDKILEGGGIIIQHNNNMVTPTKQTQNLRQFKQRKNQIYGPESKIISTSDNPLSKTFRETQSTERSIYFSQRRNRNYSDDEYLKNYQKLFHNEDDYGVSSGTYSTDDFTMSPTANKLSRQPRKPDDNRILQRIKLMKNTYTAFDEDLFEIDNNFTDSAFEKLGYFEENESEEENGDISDDEIGREDDRSDDNQLGNPEVEPQTHFEVRHDRLNNLGNTSIDNEEQILSSSYPIQNIATKKFPKTNYENSHNKHPISDSESDGESKNHKSYLIASASDDNEEGYCGSSEHENLEKRSLNVNGALEHEKAIVELGTSEQDNKKTTGKNFEVDNDKNQDFYSDAIKKRIKVNDDLEEYEYINLESEYSDDGVEQSDDEQFHIIDINEETEASDNIVKHDNIILVHDKKVKSLFTDKRKPVFDLLSEQYQDIEEMFNDDTVIKYIRTSPTKKLKY